MNHVPISGANNNDASNNNNVLSAAAFDLIEDEDSMVTDQVGLPPLSILSGGSSTVSRAFDIIDDILAPPIPRQLVPLNTDHHYFTIDRPIIDVEAYAAQFEGPARLQRLQFIAEHCPPVRFDALSLSLFTLKSSNSLNTRLYSELSEKLNSVDSTTNGGTTTSSGNNNAITDDKAWFESAKRRAETKQAHLESDLKSYKASSIKESIRRTYEELGAFCVDCGDYDAAMRNYIKARENVTAPKSLVTTSLSVLRIAVYKAAWPVVISFLAKSELQRRPEETMGAKDEAWWAQTRCLLACLAGLIDLVHGRYKSAARNFTNAPGQASVVAASAAGSKAGDAAAVAAAGVEPCSGFADLLSPNCIAIYGAICALATMDRGELQRLVIGNAHFRALLELEPDVREVVRCFYNAKYKQCIEGMEKLRDLLKLDIYLSPHVNRLYDDMRRRVLVQYIGPYSSVDLSRMATALATTPSALESELTELIRDANAYSSSALLSPSNLANGIASNSSILASVRIDSRAKVLHAHRADVRSGAFTRVVALGHDYALAAKALLLRQALLQANVAVKLPNQQSGTNPLSGGRHGSGGSRERDFDSALPSPAIEQR